MVSTLALEFHILFRAALCDPQLHRMLIRF